VDLSTLGIQGIDSAEDIPAEISRLQQVLEAIEREFDLDPLNHSAQEQRNLFVIQRLIAEMRQEYEGFMADGFHSKEDLDALSSFIDRYGADTIIEQGMSGGILREVYSGLDREDYRPEDLPENVLELGQKHTQRSLEDGNLDHISDKERRDLEAALASPEAFRQYLEEPENRTLLQNEITNSEAHAAQQDVPQPTAEEALSAEAQEADGQQMKVAQDGNDKTRAGESTLLPFSPSLLAQSGKSSSSDIGLG